MVGGKCALRLKTLLQQRKHDYGHHVSGFNMAVIMFELFLVTLTCLSVVLPDVKLWSPANEVSFIKLLAVLALCD